MTRLDRGALLALVLLAGACGTRAPVRGPQAAVEPPAWPAPPAPARIRWVRSLAGPQDAGIEKSFLRRMADTLFGRSEQYLIRPTGVAERDEVLYVADPGAQALWIFDLPNRRFAGVTRVGTAALAAPVAVAAAPAGAVFVADSWLEKVFKLDRSGTRLEMTIGDGLERPAGLAYAESAGRLYVADSVAHRIAVYGPDGRRLFVWGRRGGGDGEFNGPTHLALDGPDTLLVTDALNFRVQAFDLDGHFLWKMGHHGDGSGDLAGPKGVAADSRGHVYVVDALFGVVQIFDPGGPLLLSFGGQGLGPGQFWLPNGIFINRQNRIYVADSYNQRVQVFDFLGGPDE